MPRDATIIAVLPRATVDTAIALGTLRRRGYAVAAVLILLDEDQYAASAAGFPRASLGAAALDDAFIHERISPLGQPKA